MTVNTDKVLVLFLEDADDASDPALDDVAARGCCGGLVLPPDASPLESLLGIARDGDGGSCARLKFPKMPLALFSTQPSARSLAQELGIAHVEDADAPDAAAAARALLAGDGKQLVFIHAAQKESALWARALVRDLLAKDGEGDAARCLVAVVRSAQLALRPTPATASVFRPRQSFEKVDGEYPKAAAKTAELRRLLLAFYQADRTRRDQVQRLDEAEIDAVGGYGAMSALMFAQEVAFRLGYAPKYGA